MNTLYYGDNLKILREYIKDESVDLVYLDPPFNSNRNYNVLFRNESGAEAESQITAFEDTWHWSPQAAETYDELINEPDQVGRMIESFRQFIGTNQMMAYLVMMAVRLKELHRVLKPTGSLYLHCDPTASHYLKILLDAIFGAPNFRNEITWKRQSAHSDAKKRFPNVSDTILFYCKSTAAKFEPQYGELDPDYVEKFYRHDDEDGRGPYQLADMASPNPRPNMMYEWMGFPWPAKGWRYQRESMEILHKAKAIWYPTKKDGTFDTTKRPRLKRYLFNLEGSIVTNIWLDINPLHAATAEMLGYPTQKPVALLERIIQASSNEGDIVLDPFCGCGTTIAAAQKLNREWIGIDVTHLAVGLMKLRLKDQFKMVPDGTRTLLSATPRPAASGVDDSTTSPGGDPAAADKSVRVPSYRVIGQPEDLEGAKELASKDRYGFQWWILPLIGAKAFGSEAGKKEGKMGADKGVDGMIVFTDDNSGKAKKVIVSVKSGHPNVTHIRDLGHVIERDDAAIGVYLTLEPPTKPMLEESTGKGFYHSPGWNKDYPRIQILTVEDLLAGKTVQLPPNLQTYKQGERVNSSLKNQQPLDFDAPSDTTNKE
jgi:site-specific DNA-methyltransferase (adenine-specific)